MVPNETAAEDVRNAMAILDTLGTPSGGSVAAEVRARLVSALSKLENPATSPVGAARGTVVAHPGVPASLYMMVSR